MNKKVYIVDDDESVRRALKLLMNASGFIAESFSSAEEFFKAIPHHALGCLILDINMPGLNGWQTNRLIQAESDRPVIIISGDTDGDLKSKSLKEGAVGFLQKPFNDQELIDLVNQACCN